MTSISAVIPCYNQGVFISECIESILNQTSEVQEIIVINDGSTDMRTVEILKNLSFPKTRVINQSKQGPSAARNRGFREAIGSWILVIDADDYFAPTFVSEAVKIINNDNSIGAVSSWVQFFGRINHVWECTGGTTLNFLTKNSSSSAALVRRSCWERASGYDEKLPSFEDWDFWIRLTSLGFIVKIVEQPLFFYRKHSVSLLAESEKNYQPLYEYIFTKNQEIYSSYFPQTLLTQIEEIKSLKVRNRELAFYTPKSLFDLIHNITLLTKRYIKLLIKSKV